MIQSNQSSESMIEPVEDRKSVLSGIARAAAEAVARKRAERVKLSNQVYLERALERLDRLELISTPDLMSKRTDMSGRVVYRYSWLDIIEIEEEAKDDVQHYQRALGLLVEPVPVVQPVAVPVAVTVPVQSTPRRMPVPIAAAECRTTFCSLNVGNLPADVIAEDLYRLCSSARIQPFDVFINRYRDLPTETHGKPLRKSSHRGDKPWLTQKRAFINFKTPAEAAKALAALQGVRLTCSYTNNEYMLMVEPARQDRGGRR